VSVDLPAIAARKNAVVQSFRDGQQRRVDKHPKLRFRSEIEKERATLRQENHPSSKLPRWASFSTPTPVIDTYLNVGVGLTRLPGASPRVNFNRP
jgi:hypothetical protein